MKKIKTYNIMLSRVFPVNHPRAGEETGFLTVYVNVNYAPGQLEDTMYRIYQENIRAVCDFNFQFYFAMEDEE